MNRLAAALALAALAFPGAALAAERSAQYTLQIELATATAHESVQGTGLVDAERGLSSLAFSMSVGGKTTDVSMRYRRLDMRCVRTKTDASITISRGTDE